MEQVWKSARILHTHVFGHVCEVELDWSATTRLEVYEHQPLIRPEHVARMWLAVQELLWGAARADRLAPASQSVGEKLTVGVNHLRSLLTTSDQPLGLGDSICEMRRRQVDLPR